MATLLLMPGLDGTGELFGPLQLALGRSAHASVMRYRDERSFEDYVDSAASALPERNAVLIAESFSGPIALALMARYPLRIRCAVLCATFAVSPFRSLTGLARFMPAFLFGMSPLQPAMLRHFCFGGESDSALTAQVISVVRKVPAVTMRQRIITLARVDMRPSLAQVIAPVLYLQASQDRIVNARLSRDLMGALPRVTVRTINGPHLLLQTRPQECADVIAKFVGGMSGASDDD